MNKRNITAADWRQPEIKGRKMKYMRIMKKTAATLSILLAITAFFGCTTLNAPAKLIPVPKSSEDTLIAVPVIIIDGRTAAFTNRISYFVRIENIDNGEIKNIPLTTDSHGYRYIAGIPEGKYLIKEYTTMGMMNNAAKPISLDQYLEVKKGELTIFPGKFVVYIYDNPDFPQGSYLYPSFRDVNKEEMSRIEAFLENEENYSLWK